MTIRRDRVDRLEGRVGVDMALRSVDTADRTIIGCVAPYDDTSYLVPDPGGERVCRGAFTKSIEQYRAESNWVRLFVGHQRTSEAAVGKATAWADGPDGLSGRFEIKHGPEGDQVLEDARGGYFGGLSMEMFPLVRRRAEDGVMEIREAALVAVALVGTPAYPRARIEAVSRSAQAVLERFAARPEIDLSPIPAVWLYDSGRH